jgi:protein-tyrosine phosphatase
MSLVDFHNHLMPGVDDGAQSDAEAFDALLRFKEQGVTTVVATPHLEGSLTVHPDRLEHRLSAFDRAFEMLRECAERAGGMKVERGVELLLDLPEPDLSDSRVRLGGGQFFLMEFPFMAVPPHSTRVVQSLCATSFVPIIAHPERYRGMRDQLDLAATWKQSGALLQVNSGSLLGKYGSEAREAAFELLARGLVDYICSDYHARGVPSTGECRARIAMDAEEQAFLLMQTNPARMLQGQRPIPVPPLKVKRGLWGRVAELFR